MKLPANFQCGVIKDNYIWFFDNQYKCVCKMDIAANTVEAVAYGYWNFICATTYMNGDNIYFASVNEINIIIYNTKDNAVREIRYRECEEGMCFWPLSYDNKIFFAHQVINLKNVFCYFDCKEEKFYETDKVKDKVKALFKYEDVVKFRFINPYNYASQRFGAIEKTNKYFRYDFLSGDGEVVELNRKAELFAVMYDGNNIWALQCNSNSILKIGAEIKEFKIDTIEKDAFSYVHILKKYVIVLPKFSDVVVLIDKESEETYTIKLPINRNVNSNYSKALECCEYNNKIYVFPLGLKDLYVIDEADLTISILEPDYLDFEKVIDDLNYHNRIESLKYRQFINENKDLNCKLFIDFIKGLNNNTDSEEKNKENVGKNIWNYFSNSKN